VEDLAQEVWLVALARSPAFPDERATKAWLGQVCRRIAAGERRSRARTPLLRTDAEPDLPVEPEQPEYVERELDEQKSLSALGRLSETQLDVLTLYGSGDLSMREVADLMGEPEPTVYSRYRTAIDEVSRELRRSERVGPRLSSIPAPRISSIPPSLPVDRESAADAGALILYRSDDEFVLGRVGNVVIARWRKRMYERSSADLSALLKMVHARLNVPLVLLNDANADLVLPNATERGGMRHMVRDTSKDIAVVVDIFNAPTARLLTAIVNGMVLISRANLYMSFFMVPSIEAAKNWAQAHTRTPSGPLAWNVVADAIRHIRAEP
jgi:RNA polymerase sigma factor (sigma-70 family)